MTLKKDQMVVRHNNLIEASYSTTLLQQRLLYWIIAQIKMTDRQFQTYRITIKEMHHFLGLNNRNIYQETQQAAEGMVGTVVKIQDINKDRTLVASLVSSVEYNHGKGYVDISLDPKLRPYLLNLQEKFTRAYLSELSTIGSVYAARIFDLLIQYKKIGKRTCTVDDLRSMLDLKDKYPLYGNLKKRIIIPAVKEINRSTNLQVDWLEIKKGRAVHAIEFTFRDVARPVLEAENADEIPTDHHGLIRRIMSHGISKRVAEGFVVKYADTDVDRILEALSQVESGVRSGKITNAGGFLRRAIEEDWREQPSLFVRSIEDEKKRIADQVAKQKERDRHLTRIDDEIKQYETQYLDARIEFVRAAVADLTDEERNHCVSLLKDLSDPRVSLWMKYGAGAENDLASKTILSLTEQILSEQYDKDFPDFEEYLEVQGLPSLADLQSQRDQYL